MRHEAVLEAAVVGKIGDDGLTRTLAYVVLKPGRVATQRWRRRCRCSSRTSSRRYKYPREIRFLAELPKTATGKIQRFKLRERAAALIAPLTVRWRPRSPISSRRPEAAAGVCVDRRRALRARRSSCSCTRAWARSRCGSDYPRGAVRGGGRRAVSSSRATATDARRRGRRRRSGRSNSCTRRRSDVLPALFAQARHRRPAVAVRPQRRRLHRAALRRGISGARRGRRRGRAARVRRGCERGQHRAGARRLRRDRPAAKARALPRRSRLRVSRLERHLARPRVPRLEYRGLLPRIRCPLLAVQGEDDEYGTMAQIDAIARRVPQARLLKLPACGHSPHRDQPEGADRRGSGVHERISAGCGCTGGDESCRMTRDPRRRAQINIQEERSGNERTVEATPPDVIQALGAAGALGAIGGPKLASARPARSRSASCCPIPARSRRWGARSRTASSSMSASRAASSADASSSTSPSTTNRSPSKAADNVNKLIKRDNVDVIVGTVHSGVQMAIVKAARENNTLLIIPNAGVDEATGPLCAPNIFRVSFSNSQPGLAMGIVAALRGYKTAVTITWKYAAGEQSVGGFKETFEKGGGKVREGVVRSVPERGIPGAVDRDRVDQAHLRLRVLRRRRCGQVRQGLRRCRPQGQGSAARRGISYRRHARCTGRGRRRTAHDAALRRQSHHAAQQFFRLAYAKAYSARPTSTPCKATIRRSCSASDCVPSAATSASDNCSTGRWPRRRSTARAASSRSRLRTTSVQDFYLRKVENGENKSIGLAAKALADPGRGCTM